MNIILVGEVATGKSEIRNWLCENLRYNKPHILTTDKTKDGKDSYSVVKFTRDMVLDDLSYMWKQNGEYYGLTTNDLINDSEDKVYIFDIPTALQYMMDSEEDESVVVYVYATDDFRVNRLKENGFSDDEIDKIMMDSNIEDSLSVDMPYILALDFKNSTGDIGKQYFEVEFAGDADITCINILEKIKDLGD